jgi:hypothetical protein
MAPHRLESIFLVLLHKLFGYLEQKLMATGPIVKKFSFS